MYALVVWPSEPLRTVYTLPSAIS